MVNLRKRLLSLCLGLALSIGVGVGLSGTHGEVTKIYAADGDKHEFTTDYTSSTLLNNGNTPDTVTIPNQGYYVKQVIINWSHNKSNDGITATVKVGGTELGSGKVGGAKITTDTTIGDGNTSLQGAVTVTWTSSLTGTKKGTLAINSFTLVEGSSGVTYTVSFNGNGAEGTMTDVTDVSGQYTLPDSTFTAPTGKAFAGWKANNEGDTLAAGDKYTVSADTTFYAQWVNSYSVTFNAGENGTGSYVDSNKPEGTYTLPAFEELTGITASSGYQFYNYSVNGETKYPNDEITLSGDTSVDVIFGIEKLSTTYDFTKNFSTYARAWSGYANHTGLNGKTTIGGEYAATIDLYYASKQSDNISNMPVFATKTASGSWTKVLQFTLTETGYKIDSITVTFAQWTTKTPSVSLYKGTEVSGTALDTAKIGTKNTLTASNFNGTTFSVGYSDGSTSNVQSGLQSIFIEISSSDTFGTLDHIKIAQEPTKTVYHVGETFDSTGLSVVAYDGADEDTANFKDVTSEVEMALDNTYTFVDGDVPGMDEEVTYGEKSATFHIYVYATGNYTLVTKNLNNWSGKYLIIGVDKNSDNNTVAMDSYLANPDTPKNYEAVDISDSATITAGRELEWTISSIDGGYSIRGQSGKYIGSLTSKDNGLLSDDTAILNTITFNEASSEATIKGTVDCWLKFNADSSADRFRYYKTSGTIKLYRLEDSTSAREEAETYAELFNDNIKCDATGKTQPAGWATLKEMWSDGTLSTEAQIILTNVDLDTETNVEVKLCIETYEYIVNKYNSVDPETYNDFMGRNLQPASASNIINKLHDNKTSIITIVLVSTIAITTIGGCFFLRKKKEN